MNERRKIDLLPGHSTRMEKYLKKGIPVNVTDLIRESKSSKDVELVIDFLYQEAGNNFFLVQNMEVFLESVQVISGELTPENILSAVELIEEFETYVLGKTKNIRNIGAYLDGIEKKQREKIRRKKRSLFSQRSLDYIIKIRTLLQEVDAFWKNEGDQLFEEYLKYRKIISDYLELE